MPVGGEGPGSRICASLIKISSEYSIEAESEESEKLGGGGRGLRKLLSLTHSPSLSSSPEGAGTWKPILMFVLSIE